MGPRTEQPAGQEERESRRVVGLLLSAIVGLLLFGIAIIVVGSIANHRLEVIERAWTERIGDTEALEGRFPPRTANDSARRIETLSASFGIDLVPTTLDGRDRPVEEDERRFHRERAPIGGYLQRHVERDSVGIDAPPPEVSAFLRTNAATLDEMRRILLEQTPPLWESDIRDPFRAAIPNLLGQIHLHKVLLTEALSRGHAGDAPGALDTVEASWRLASSFRDDPEFIVHQTAATIVRMQAGVLRQLSDVPVEWADRLLGHDWRRSMIDSLGIQARAWSGALTASPPDDSAVARMLIRVVKPYAKLCQADLASTWLQGLASAEAPVRPCDRDLTKSSEQLQVARWNYIARHLNPQIDGSLESLVRLQLDLELTAFVIRVRSGLEREQDSLACPGDRWRSIAEDEGRRIEFTRDVDLASAPRRPSPLPFRVP